MMSWQQITVHKPRPVKMPQLGRRAHDSRGRERPLSDGERAQILRDLKHSLCVEHVRVQGYRQAVCIEKGQDRELVLADARRLLLEDRPERRRQRRSVVILP